MIARMLALLLVIGAAGCGAPPRLPEAAPGEASEGPLSGMIGVAVRADGNRVIVTEVGEPARSAGLRAGDVVVEYDGVPVSSILQFERRVLKSPPGGRVDVRVWRDGTLRLLEVPVHQVVTASRG